MFGLVVDQYEGSRPIKGNQICNFTKSEQENGFAWKVRAEIHVCEDLLLIDKNESPAGSRAINFCTAVSFGQRSQDRC